MSGHLKIGLSGKYLVENLFGNFVGEKVLVENIQWKILVESFGGNVICDILEPPASKNKV